MKNVKQRAKQSGTVETFDLLCVASNSLTVAFPAAKIAVAKRGAFWPVMQSLTSTLGTACSKSLKQCSGLSCEQLHRDHRCSGNSRLVCQGLRSSCFYGWGAEVACGLCIYREYAACIDRIDSMCSERRSPCIAVAVHAKTVSLIKFLTHGCEMISWGILEKIIFPVLSPCIVPPQV